MFVLAICLSFPAKAQVILNGSAKSLGNGTYELTPDLPGQNGSIWSEDKIDLNSGFDFIFKMYLGSKNNNGADGMYFALQPVSNNIGLPGEYIGFGNVSPALGIEFDTWQNLNRKDPPYDHIAVMKDGNINHDSPDNLMGPVTIKEGFANVEDGKWHDLRIIWEPGNHSFQVFFDCINRIDLTVDLVNDIFRGEPMVYFGFTSATGGLSNAHRIEFTEISSLEMLRDTAICPGETVKLEVGSNLYNYLWTPSTYLNQTQINNPIAKPFSEITYHVTAEDDCGMKYRDSIQIAMRTDCPNELISLPNAFSPNEDKVNDTYEIKYPASYRLKQMSIYNRWGELIFEDDSGNNKWDGRRNGKPMPESMYAIKVEFITPGNASLIKTGSFLLIR